MLMNAGSLIPEATISDLHEAMRAGDLASRALVERYLDRIEATTGPEINAIVTVNPNAEQRASTLDKRFDQEGLTGALHGIPVLVKDQVWTVDIVTTYVSVAFAEYIPSTDATIVRRLRDAGAVVLAKTNLPDWAAGFVSHSSTASLTKNPLRARPISGRIERGHRRGCRGESRHRRDRRGNRRLHPGSGILLQPLRAPVHDRVGEPNRPLSAREPTGHGRADGANGRRRGEAVRRARGIRPGRRTYRCEPTPPHRGRIPFGHGLGGLDGRRFGVLRSRFGEDHGQRR